MSERSNGGVCRHYVYDPEQGPRCARGLSLAGKGSVLKCLSVGLILPDPCPGREEFTREEIDAHLKLSADAFDRTAKGIACVPAGRDAGKFKCPNCADGVVRWRREGRNRHLRIACSTPNCMRALS